MGEARSDGRRRTGAWLFLVALVVAGNLALAFAWMERDGAFDRPLSHDAAWRRLDAYEIWEAAERDGLAGWLAAGYHHDDPHPPLIPMAAALCMWAAGGDASPLTLWWSQAFFAALFGFGTFRLARNFGGPGFALAATALTFACPVVVSSLRSTLWPQMPMAAVVIWALDALVRSRGLTRTGTSVAFGVLLGLATLTKMLAPLYLAGSGAVALLLGLRDAGTRRLAVRNATLALAATAAVVSTWYLEHWRITAGYAVQVAGPEGSAEFSQGRTLDSVERWLYFPRTLLEHGLGPVLSWLVVPAVLWLAVRTLARRATDAARRARREAALVLLAGPAVGTPLLVFGAVQGHAYYLVGFAPLLAIAAVAAVPGATTAAGTSRRPRLLLAAVYVAVAGLTLRDAYRDAEGELRRIDWPVEEFVAVMAERARERSYETIRLGHVAGWRDNAFLNPPNLEVAARQEGIPLAWVPVEWPDAAASGAPGEPLPDVPECDFLVVDTFRLRGDTPFPDTDALAAGAAALGFEARVIAEHPIGDLTALCLIELVVPPERQPFVPREALKGSGVVRHAVRFENGWNLVGSRATTDGSSVTLTSYWEPGPHAESGYRLFANILGDYRSATMPEPGRAPEGRPLVVRTTTNSPERDLDDLRILHVGLMRQEPTAFHYSPIVDSDLPTQGPHTAMRSF